ncbi:RNase H domain-containing protein [Hirsutella rhossiliensis]|uniref:RNase H domain-containing protein n=1 Tax=Hirsutella rhossiliensis TaxID=111463 RepID=A0A9P8SEX3_9HYPO|nr:RNase H domain-containing protein [Hirsutella rhossiliensis]KAH0958461.1 RNase H domain-containing protein [Hirsutella rhossiliensis]
MGTQLYRQTDMEFERQQDQHQGQTQQPPSGSSQAHDPIALLPPQDEIVVATSSAESPKKRRRQDTRPDANEFMALRLAEAENYDVVLIQEPNVWIERKSEICRTQTHQAFHVFAPERTWEPGQAPRVMSYARNDTNIRVEQICPTPTRDILWLRVNDILIINFYRHERTPGPLDYLLHQQEVPERCLVAGDFNAHHCSWQLGVRTARHGAAIAEWAAHRGLGLLNAPGKATHRVLEGAESNQDVYKIMRWSKRPSPFRAPPIKVGETVYETQAEKAKALRAEILERRVAADDIRDPWIPEVAAPHRSVDCSVTLAEATHACTSTGNTSPGVDGITVRMLRRAWNHIGEAVRELYEGCLHQGYHPTCFRVAKVVMIPKPGKRDLSTPRGWRPDLRWLGVWYDRKLSFRTHVEKWAAKAKKVAEFIQNLSNTRRGIPPRSTRHAVTACVLPILLYGAHVWHPGTLRPVWGSCRLIPARITYLKDRIQQTLNVAMRAIAPAWRTTPIAGLHRETGIPPATLLLTDALRRAAVRLRSLDARHPLTPRMSILPTPGRQLMQEYGIRPPCAARKQQASRLLRLHQMTAQAPRPRLQPPAPPQPDPTGGLDKTQAARSFREWLRACSEDTLIVYTDGSKSEDGACGYGYSVWLGPDEVVYGSGRMPLAEVYDAEVEGALKGLQVALAWAPTSLDRQRPIVICLDNTAAIRAIRGGPSISSQAAAVTFVEVAARHGDVSTRWCPGHEGIIGNERADGLAKEGCRSDGPDRPPTYAFIKRQAKAAASRDFQDWWAAATPSSYKSLELKALLGCPPELHTKRQHLRHLLAARSGHGDFADYHERFDHQEVRIECSCGRRKSPTHIFYCRKISTRHRLRLVPTADEAISQALGRGFDRFLGLVMETGFFDRICHRH